MSSPLDAGSAAWTRVERLATGAAACALLASLVALAHPWYDAKNDGAVYIATARALLAGEGYSYLGDPVRARPPGFSVLIAPLVGGDLDPGLLNLYVAAWGAAAVALLALYWRTRMPWVLALSSAAVVWLNPAFQRFAHQTMSDVPGVALLLVGLWLERWADRNPSPGREAVLGLAIGLSGLVRTGNLLLLPAIGIARIVARGSSDGPPWPRFLARRVAILFVAAFLVQMPWSLRNALHPEPIPADQTLPYSYWTGILHEDKADPTSRRLSVGEVLSRVPDQSRHMLVGLGTRLDEEHEAVAERWLALPLLVAFVFAWIRRRGSAEWFVAATLASVALYFGYQNRLLLPAFVLLVPMASEVVHAALARVAPPRLAVAIPAVGLLGWIAADLPPDVHWEEIERQHRRAERVATALEQALPAQACVASAWGFQYGVRLGRPVYSLQPALWRGGVEELERTLDRYGIDTVVLVAQRQREGELLPYFEGRYGEPERAGVARIFRVRPPGAACGEAR